MQSPRAKFIVHLGFVWERLVHWILCLSPPLWDWSFLSDLWSLSQGERVGFPSSEIYLNLLLEEGVIRGCCRFTVSPGFGWTGGEEGHIVGTRGVGTDLPNDHASLWRAGLWRH